MLNVTQGQKRIDHSHCSNDYFLLLLFNQMLSQS